MKNKNEPSPVEMAKSIIGELTPLKGHDCGQLCSAACCKGDEQTGMLLFPGERTALPTIKLPDGGRLAVCSGRCDRSQRPLACMFFPFFPTVDDRGKVYAEIDARAGGVCPLAAYCDEVDFDRAFLKAVKAAGKKLAGDEDCLEFMRGITAQIDELNEIRDSILAGTAEKAE